MYFCVIYAAIVQSWRFQSFICCLFTDSWFYNINCFLELLSTHVLHCHSVDQGWIMKSQPFHMTTTSVHKSHLLHLWPCLPNSASSQLETGKSYHVKPVKCAVTCIFFFGTIMCWLLAGVGLAGELPPVSLLPWSLVSRHFNCNMPLWRPEEGCHGIPANDATFSRRWCQRWKWLGRMTLAISLLVPVLCKVSEDK